MRNKLFLVLVFLSLLQGLKAQNYSQFRTTTAEQDWVLYDVNNTDFWTIVDIKVYINSNKSYALYIKGDTYISGNWGCANYAQHVEINNREWKFDKSYIFGERNKGKFVPVRIWFPRIPCGMSEFSYCEPGFTTWSHIPVYNNPNSEHTKWTRNSLFDHWNAEGINKIEGIYDFMVTNNQNWWGNSKHSLAVVKSPTGYDVVYLAGSNYSGAWTEGDLKGRISATSVSGLFKSTLWLMENKRPSANSFYISFDTNSLYIYENDQNINAEFLKIYPTAEDALLEEAHSSSSTNSKGGIVSTGGTKGQLQATGSGFMVDQSGVIATNYHVIENANAIEVFLNNGKELVGYDVKVLCSDKTNDIALLRIDDPNFKQDIPLPYSLSLKTQDVGTSIFAMGYPRSQILGEEIKVTDGIINSRTGFQGDIVTYQISATIAPGSSGGALFNQSGEIIGITSAGISKADIAQNVNYAIKSIYLYTLMESVSLNIPAGNMLKNMSFQEKIKSISPFIAYIKIY
mgnify:CR=1 FL=1